MKIDSNYGRLSWVNGLLLFLFWTALVQANGGTILLTEDVGAYDLTITASPFPLQVGVNDISVLLGRQSDSQIVLGAAVSMTAAPVDHPGQLQNFSATHAKATNKLYYAADVIFPTPGRWQLTVRVDGPEGVANTAIKVQVEPGQSFNYFRYISLVGLPLLVLVFLLFVFSRRTKNEFSPELESED